MFYLGFIYLFIFIYQYYHHFHTIVKWIGMDLIFPLKMDMDLWACNVVFRPLSSLHNIIMKRRKSHFRPYIFMRFPLWSLFFFPLLYSLSWKTHLILVLSVSALTAKSYVASRTIKIIIINFYFGIKKATSASKLKKNNNNLLILTK